MSDTAAAENAIAIEAWNTVLFDKFCRFRHLLTLGLSSHGDALLDAHPPPPAGKVLDVGCGFGDMTQQIAERLGPGGEAIGVDAAQRFVDDATREVTKAGVGNARFFAADVQLGSLGGPYDAVYSRFGTMFFDLPGAALRNIRKSMVPGSCFAMVVWRKREANPWLHAAEVKVREIVPVIEHDQTDQVHCGPGPFSMAGPDMVSDLMTAAGFSEIAFRRNDADICAGRDVDEALEFAMALGPAGEIIRLAGEEGERLQPQVLAELREVMADYVRPDGSVWAASSTWIVSGRA